MLLSSGGAWSLNGSSSAACPRPAFIPKHDPPSEDCLCGLYGEKTAEKVIEELSRLSLMSSWLKLSRPRIGPDWQAQGILVGKLKVWGKLIVTENYRFEHGRIVAFMPTPLQMQIVKDLEAQCDIPTSRWMWGRWLVGGPLNDRLLPVDALFPDAETVLIPAVARNLCRPPSTAIMSLPERRKMFAPVLQELSSQDRHLALLRFGLADGRPRTIEETAVEAGVAPDRVDDVSGRIVRWLDTRTDAQPGRFRSHEEECRRSLVYRLDGRAGVWKFDGTSGNCPWPLRPEN